MTCRELISAVPHEHYAPNPYRLRPVGVSQYLTDGHRPWQPAAHRPAPARSHPRQHRAVPPAGLFSGDIVYDGKLLDDIHGADQKNYVATIARLRNLPVTVVHPGHESPFDGTRLREIADAYIAARP